MVNRVEMLTVVKRLKGSRYLCECDCGNQRIVNVGHFNTKKIKSCGCHVTRHGHCPAGKPSRTYVSYGNMMARCHNKKNKRYCDYGGKGIIVCARWRKGFKYFLEDMGACPDGLTIDRIDNALGYFPSNCRWASRRRNQRNRDVAVIWSIAGEEYPTSHEAAKSYGVSAATIAAWCKGRIAAGRYYPPKPLCKAFYRRSGRRLLIDAGLIEVKT